MLPDYRRRRLAAVAIACAVPLLALTACGPDSTPRPASSAADTSPTSSAAALGTTADPDDNSYFGAGPTADADPTTTTPHTAAGIVPAESDPTVSPPTSAARSSARGQSGNRGRTPDTPSASSTPDTPSQQAPPAHAPVQNGSLNNDPTQPATIMFDGDAVSAYERRGALVIAGRTNYSDPGFERVSAAGGTVLVYLNPIIDNSWGRYQDMLMNSSACGPAVAHWPGNPSSTEYGALNDFRAGGALQGKLECVLETMVRENPHMGGWFADDVGTRSYYSGVNWDSWSASDKRAYRDGAIALTKTFRSVADRHGLIFLVNGAWNGGDVDRLGGGYPDASKSGTALADGGMIENHDQNLPYMIGYSCSNQWASQSPMTHGMAFNYATTRTTAGRNGFADQACVAYAGMQGDYSTPAAAWTSFHPTGLPTRVAG